MFNFTTQTIYNQISTSGANKNLWVSGGAKPALRIGNTRFDAANIESVQVKAPTPEYLASVEFDLSELDLTKDGIARIALYVTLAMDSQDSFYANDLVYKGRPFYIEFAYKAGETASTIASRAKVNADKYLLMTSDVKLLNVTATSGVLKIEATNGFQQLTKAVLQVYDPEAHTIDCCANEGDFVDVIKGVPVAYVIDSGTLDIGDTPKKLDETGTLVALADDEVPITPGLEAFGDYNWIIHNLRLPTCANTNFWAVTKEEMPAVGQVYTQFIITMAVDRDGIAGHVVGQRATSVTTHVLYVAGNVATSATPAYVVNGAIATLLGASAATKMKTDADDKLVDPFDQN